MTITLRARAAVFAALALLVFGAAGIALAVQQANGPATPAPTPVVEEEPPSPIPLFPHVMTGYDVEGMTLSELTGYLIVIEERCYGLQTNDGAFLAVFPEGARATADGLAIEGVAEFREGWRVTGYAVLMPPPKGFEPPAPECATDRVVVLDYVRSGF